MRILAIDSSGMVASVALWEDELILAEFSMNYKKTHSQTLLPMLEDVREKIDLDMTTIDVIAVAAGPGSFTGLRIGSATAKGLGFALEKPIIPVPTVDGLAYNLYGTDKVVCPIMDARRSQTYTGLYTFVRNEEKGIYDMIVICKQCAVYMDDILDRCNKLGKEVIFLGDGVPVFQDAIREKLTVPFSFAPAHMNRQRAATVASLGARMYELGKVESAAEHAPEYLRLSQAERERLEQKEQPEQKE